MVDVAALAARTPTGEARDVPDGWDAADALAEWQNPETLHQAVIAAVSALEAGPSYISTDRFSMSSDGLTTERIRGRGERARAEMIRISDPFEVIGRARDSSGQGWAKWLRWEDADGRKHEYPVPDAALHGDLGTLAAELASRGLTISRSAEPSWRITCPR